MLALAKLFFIISVILLPDYYFLASPFRIRTILMVLLLIIYALGHLKASKRNFQICGDTRNILIAAFLLLFYIYISDVIKNDPVDAANLFYPNLLIPAMLLVYEYRLRSFKLVRALYYVFSVSILFAIIQIAGIQVNLSTLVPNIGPIGSDQMIAVTSPQGLRVSGAAYSTIGFAEYLSIMLIITYYRLFDRKSISMIGLFIVMTGVLLFTQTRSAIYGLLPSVAVVHLYYMRKSKDMKKVVFVLGFAVLAIYLFLPFIENQFYRLMQPFDASVIERFQTNYYATLGVFREAPIFGIPKERAWEVISVAAWQRGLAFGDIFRFTTTHHNQIFYYFRYYGLVGVGLLILLYIFVFRKILRTPSLTLKMALLSIFIFDLQYSLGHNNKLITNIILWVLLALSFRRTCGLSSTQEIGN